MDLFDLRQWESFQVAGGDPSKPALIDQVSIDSRSIDSSRALFVALPGSRTDGHQFIPAAIQAGAAYIIAKKGYYLSNLPEKCTILHAENPLEAMQSIAHCYRMQLKTKIVGISGSYGKTMVKDLLHAFVRTSKSVVASPESFNSQIGVPLSLFTISNKHEIALIEAAFSLPDEMERLALMIAPDHTILTHIGKKHLATLGSLNAVADEMMQLAKRTPVNNWVLLPHNRLTEPFLSSLKSQPFFWNEADPQLPIARALANKYALQLPYQVEFPDGITYRNKTTIGFSYFLDLLNITIKAAWLLQTPSESIKMVLDRYVAEPMRTEIWRSPTGTTFINDTYCSDPQSISKSLRHLEQTGPSSRKAFIFGGLRENHCSEAAYRHVGQLLRQNNLDLVLLVGIHPFKNLLAELSKVHVKECADYQEAIDWLRNWVRQDDVVLIKGEKKEPLDILTEAFNDSICTNQCWINLAAIEANITTIRNKLHSGTRIMVMVKALGYGTNDIHLGRFLESCGVDILGVSYVDEGVSLKRAGIRQDIFVINAAIYEAAKAVKWGLEIGVSEKCLIEAIAHEAKAQKKQIRIHLHVDTGMSRFGCRPEEALSLAKFIQSFPQLKLEGIMTHFACADDPEQDAFTLKQAHLFNSVIAELRSENIDIPWSHASNSSAAMRFDFPQFNMARIGLAIFGLYPSEATKQALELRLALSLLSRVVGINTCHAGETISYGRMYKVERPDQRIAVLPIGYFDGLHRNYSGKGSVVIRGRKAPMVGNICMDFMMVDISDIPEAQIGDPVLIFGEDEHGQYLSPEELAQSGDSIVYELITCLGPRIQRIFIHEEAFQIR